MVVVPEDRIVERSHRPRPDDGIDPARGRMFLDPI